MVSPDGPPVSNPISGTWRNSFADKGQKGRDLQKFESVEDSFATVRITMVHPQALVEPLGLPLRPNPQKSVSKWNRIFEP
jgi:hypothetical protein